jgi:hypothetical protein
MTWEGSKSDQNGRFLMRTEWGRKWPKTMRTKWGKPEKMRNAQQTYNKLNSFALYKMIFFKGISYPILCAPFLALFEAF